MSSTKGQRILSDRRKYIPYGRQQVNRDDIEAVVEVLRSDWLTTGPGVENFERAFAAFVGVDHAVAVSSGTAALHSAVFAAGIGPGDEVIVPAITFVATANSVIYQGGTPIFADVSPDTLLIDPSSVREMITDKTKAVIAVDYAGQPCDYDELNKIAKEYDLRLIADACHSLGATYNDHFVGSLAWLNAFSFHPVKHITTGEGGMITTNDRAAADRMRSFRNHGIDMDHARRAEVGRWNYEMTTLGYNYRISDFQCALGVSQLGKLSKWVKRRREIAAKYDDIFKNAPGIKPLGILDNREHAYHLYVVCLSKDLGEGARDRVFEALRDQSIGVNVHYSPVFHHPFYKKRYAKHPSMCPVAESVAARILSLPIFPALLDEDIDHVAKCLIRAVSNGNVGASDKKTSSY